MSVDYEEMNLAQPGSETDSFTPARYRQFVRGLPKGRLELLDVGCNTGRGGCVVRDARPDVRLTGLDCVGDRLRRLPEGVYADTLENSATSIDVSDGAFDAVVAGEFIEHLTREDALTAIAEFYRVLKPGGRLLLTTPNPRYVRNVLSGRTVVGGAHLSEYEPHEMRDLLKRAGFDSVRIRGTGRVSMIIGTRIPLLSLYGSYMAIADR